MLSYPDSEHSRVFSHYFSHTVPVNEIKVIFMYLFPVVIQCSSSLGAPKLVYRLGRRGGNFLIIDFKDYLFVWKVIGDIVTFKECVDQMFFGHYITGFVLLGDVIKLVKGFVFQLMGLDMMVFYCGR